MKTRKLIGLLFILPLLAACTGNKQSDETAQTETFTKDTIPTGPVSYTHLTLPTKRIV